MDRVPARHLHWGSDFSPVLGAAPFAETLKLPGLTALPPADIAMIMGKGLMTKIGAAREAVARRMR